MLRRADALERLLAGLDGADRLILLGDVVELAERRASISVRVAEPILRRIGERMRSRQVCLVPGNHDHVLVREWARRLGGGLAPSTPVPPSASPLLERLVGWLGGEARVSVSYPGMWAREDVWVAHGHHLNRHLLPRNATGMSREWLGRPSSAEAPGDYEEGSPDSRGVGVVKAPLTLGRRLIDPQIAPLTAWLLGHQLRRAAIPAMRRVVGGMGIEARFVVFGHVHRLGPLVGDEEAVWRGERGPALLNTGSWLFEPLLVRHASPPHPYWPGGAVMIEDGADPQAVGLLDDLGAADLLGRRSEAGSRGRTGGAGWPARAR